MPPKMTKSLFSACPFIANKSSGQVPKNSRIHLGREKGLRVSGPGTLASLLVRGLTRFSRPYGFLSCLTVVGSLERWPSGPVLAALPEALSLVSSTSTHAR